MSAQEVIEQIKAMPDTEQQQVAAFVRKLETLPVNERTSSKVRPDYDAILEQIFEEHDGLLRKLAQ